MPGRLDVKDLKKGDILYECNYGRNIKTECLEDAKDTGKGWSCKVKTLHGKLNLYESYDCGAYCLRLYNSPQYS